MMSEEMLEHVLEYGWPGKDWVLDGSVLEQPPAPLPDDWFQASADFNLWGYERAARNIDEDKVDDKTRHKLVEAGLYNAIDWVGQDVALSGDLLFIIEGIPADPASTQRRMAVFVSGLTFNPKVLQCKLKR